MAISFGNEFQVDASGFFANVVKLTSTTGICFYSTAGSDIVAARHLTLSGDNITAGSKLVVDNTVLATFGKNIRSVRLTDTSVLIAYSFNGNAHKARVVSVSGTTLTAHAAINLTDTANIRSNSLDFLTSTAVVYVYGDSGGTGKARILTVSGTTVTENAAFTFDANCFNNVVAALSTTKAVVVFADASNGDALTGEVLDISGTTITGNADQTLSATAADTTIDFRIGAAALDSTHIIVQWFKTVVGSNILAVTASEAGGSLSAGTTITPQVGGANQNNMIAALSATRALGVAGDIVIEYSVAGTTTTKEELATLGSAAITDDSWIALLGSVSSIAVWDSSIESIPVFVSGDAGSYIIGTAIDNETDGDTAWLTAWRDSIMYLQRWDLPSLTKELEISLGAATLAEVQARSRVAYPFAGSDQKMWVFGRMASPAFVTGTVHLMETNGGGASGTWTEATSLSSWADADVLDSLFVSPDQDGLGNRTFTAIRRQSSAPPELWRGLGGLALVGTIPFPTGSSVEYRGMHIGRNEEISIGTATLNSGAGRIFSAISPYTIWIDKTFDYPSGTVEVLRYL